MPEVKQLTPEEAAQFVLLDIRNDPAKLKALQEVPKSGEYVHVGKMVFSEVYGTPMKGEHDSIDASFRQKVYRPLGFEVVAMSEKDVPSDVWMMHYMGKFAKELRG